MSRLRFLTALLIGKGIRWTVRLFGRGAGTALPGLVALAIDPSFLSSALPRLPNGSIVISGTNGKTTTARMLRAIMAKTGTNVIANKEGSNLLRGIAAAWIGCSSGNETIHPHMGIWEVDEATLPLLLDIHPPRICVLLNLFRDQLDRYGEVDILRKKWAQALQKLPPTTQLILNADDPLIVSIAPKGRPVTFFGIQDARAGTSTPPSHRDARDCFRCGGPLSMRRFFAGHLSHFSCPACGWHRPKPEIAALHIQQHGLQSMEMTMKCSSKRMRLTIPIPGNPAVYSALAAIATAQTLKINESTILAGIERLQRPFGRWEEVQIGPSHITIALMKNPAAATAALKTLAATKPSALMIVLNDRIADGTDVSWIWDTPFELLPKTEQLLLSGTRAHDLAVRVKYAQENGKILTIPSVKQAIDTVLKTTPNNVFVLATYTAMLDVRRALARHGSGRKHLEDTDV